MERYLKEEALADEADGLMRTYLVRHGVTGELVGYFSLKAGLVALNEKRMPDLVLNWPISQSMGFFRRNTIYVDWGAFFFVD